MEKFSIYSRCQCNKKKTHNIPHESLACQTAFFYIGTPQSKLMIMFHIHEHNHKITIIFTSSFASMLLLSLKLGIAKRSKSFRYMHLQSTVFSLYAAAHTGKCLVKLRTISSSRFVGANVRALARELARDNPLRYNSARHMRYIARLSGYARLVRQGVVTFVIPVEPSATGIKIFDQQIFTLFA